MAKRVVSSSICMIIILVAAFALAVSSAKAQVTDDLTMTFQSGATFNGTVTFASDYSSVTGVDGILTGYQSGTEGYVGSGSDNISWIWDPGDNYASGTDNFGTFLMDGTGSETYGETYWNWIAFTYDYTNAPTLEFSGVGYGNGVDYDDPMLGGTLSSVPEPSALALLGIGVLSLGFLRCKRA